MGRNILMFVGWDVKWCPVPRKKLAMHAINVSPDNETEKLWNLKSHTTITLTCGGGGVG